MKAKAVSNKILKDFESFVNSKNFSKRRLFPQYSSKHSFKILDINEDEWLCNFDNFYMLYNESNKSLKSFGSIFDSKLKSSKDIPWSKKKKNGKLV